MIAKMEINITIEQQMAEGLDRSWLNAVCERVLRARFADSETEMGLLVTGQERIRELNKNYRGKDKPTDVLSFYMTKGSSITEENDEYGFAVPPDGFTHLGEVIISYPQAVIQAEERNHPIKKELAALIIHGILHLLGFDHNTDEEEAEMKALEEDIMSNMEDLLL